MTARLKGNHKAISNALSDSPEFQAVIKLVATIAGEHAIYSGPAAESVRTCCALLLTQFRIEKAAVILREKPVNVRQRVHRMRVRVMQALRDINFSIPVRPSVDQNLQRWDPTTFDDHAELSEEPGEDGADDFLKQHGVDPENLAG